MAKIKNVIYTIKITGSTNTYVGSAVDFCHRRSSHLCKLEDNVHSNRFLQNSYNKHGGKSAFIMEVLEYVSNRANLIEREQFHIDSYDFDDLFNLCPFASSSLGRKASKETIEKIRQNSTKHYLDGKYDNLVNYWKGKKRSVENRAKVSENNKKRIWTEEAKEKISKKNKGRSLSDDHKKAIYSANKGSKRTEESKAKISNALKGRTFGDSHKENLSKNHSRKKAVKQIDPVSKEVIQIFESITEAAKYTKTCVSSISNCCAKRVKTSQGFVWEYVQDTES